jgi:hypothetical protein
VTEVGGVSLSAGQLSGVGAVGPLTATGGTVAPGGTGTGTLSAAGPVTLGAATTFSPLLDGTNASQLLAGGPVDLGGSTLSLAFGADPPVGASFTVLATSDPGALANTFAGLAEGAVFSQGGFQFQITYQGGAGGNSVVLTRQA